MMRVLFLNNGLASGGVEKLLNDMLPLLRKRIYCELLILCSDNERYLDSLKQNQIKVTIIPAKLNSHYSRLKYISDYIKKGNFDIIHGNEFPTIYYCSLLKIINKRFRPKVLITEHNTDNRRRHMKCIRPIEKWVYSLYDGVISISDMTQRRLIEWIKPSKEDKYCVINNGIPLELFKEAKPLKKEAIIEGTKSDDKFLCMVGTFTKQKNHLFMVDVLSELPTNYKLILVGEGCMKQEIMSKAKFKGVEDRMSFIGYRKDVGSVMKTCDIVVIPSLWEGFGLISVEAMACGIPVVAFNVPGLAEIIADAGALVDVGNIEQFKQSILKFENEEYYLRIRNNGLSRADNFSISHMADEYLNFYNTVING